MSIYTYMIRLIRGSARALLTHTRSDSLVTQLVSSPRPWTSASRHTPSSVVCEVSDTLSRSRTARSARPTSSLTTLEVQVSGYLLWLYCSECWFTSISVHGRPGSRLSVMTIILRHTVLSTSSSIHSYVGEPSEYQRIYVLRAWGQEPNPPMCILDQTCYGELGYTYYCVTTTKACHWHQHMLPPQQVHSLVNPIHPSTMLTVWHGPA